MGEFYLTEWKKQQLIPLKEEIKNNNNKTFKGLQT